MMRCMRFIVVLAFKRLADEYSRQHGKDECLQKGHQHFDHVDEDREPNGQRRRAPTGINTQFAKYEDERDQTDDDDVPRHHVGKQTNDEGEGLDKHTEKLNRHQDELHTQGYARRIENVPPVMTIRAEQDHRERDQSEYRGERDVTGHVRRTGDQSENVVDENKEKNRQ